MLLKITLMVISLFVIYKQVIFKENFNDVVRDAKHLATDKNSILLLISTVVLMIFNWGIESLKWKFIVSKISPVTFIQAFNAVLSGVTISFFTPNRLGEFAGRVLHMPEESRIKATLATFIGNTAQLIATVIFGTLATTFSLEAFFELNHQLIFVINISILVIDVFLIVLFFRVSKLDSTLQKIKWMNKFALQTHAFAEYSKFELLKMLILSGIRYMIFATQYVILLKMLNVGGYWFNLYIPVAIVFLTITIVPTIALTELTVRGSVAVSIISLFSNNTLGILEASFLIWFINLVIPAIAGSFTLLSLKLSKFD